MGKRRNRRWNNKSWGEIHEAERRRVSETYGGIDADVREMFFNLPQKTFDIALIEYRKRHGQPAKDYAKKVYIKWKSGEVQMSGLVSERFLAIIPQFLDFGTKYNLLEKLCRCRVGSRVKVQIPSDMTAVEAMETALDAIHTARSTILPDVIVTRLAWISDNDGILSVALLRDVFKNEYGVIVSSLQVELERLILFAKDSICKPVVVIATREIILPGIIVELALTNSNTKSSTRDKKMPDSEHDNDAASLNLPVYKTIAVPDMAKGISILPVENLRAIVGDPLNPASLSQLSPEKLQEVIDKMVEAEIEDRTNRKRSSQNADAVARKIEQVTELAEIATRNPTVTVGADFTHVAEDGKTTIRINSKPTGCSAMLLLGFVMCGLFAWLI